MHRRPLGRGRLIAALSAVVILIGCVPFLPWYTVGGGAGDIPATSMDAFQGTGILVFLAALATLALVTLPYASERPVGVDRALSYLLVVVVGVAGLGLRILDVFTGGLPAGGLRPDLAPGLWVVGVGLIGLARGAFEIGQERDRR